MAHVLKHLRIPLTRGAAFVGVGSNALRANSRQVPLFLRQYAKEAGGSSGAPRGKGIPGESTESESNAAMFLVLTAAGIAGGYYYYVLTGGNQEAFMATSKVDYEKVYAAIAKMLEEDPDFDDGSYGPIFVRLAWHASGTYDKKDNTGGSHKGTMRFNPEAKHDANKGLEIARAKLEKVKKQFPAISYGDLWTLAGVVAVQQMGGPIIPWKPGRVDGTASDCPPDGRLPDGANPSPQHPRDVFYRMGFNDQEIVALLGAHTLGRCHTDRSGFDGPWTFAPTSFSNLYFQEINNQKWVEKNWKGPKQFVDKDTGSIMMLPADLALTKDSNFKKWVDTYAKDEKKFFEDFAKAYQKLLELGVPFKEGTKEYRFKSA